MFFSCCGVGVFAFSEPACLGGGESVSITLSGVSAGMRKNVVEGYGNTMMNDGDGEGTEMCRTTWLIPIVLD